MGPDLNVDWTMIFQSFSRIDVEGIDYDRFGELYLTDKKLLTESLIKKDDFSLLDRLWNTNSKDQEEIRKIITKVDKVLRKTEVMI